MKNFALTGGIACGKTTVSDALKQLGAHVIDTDLIARRLVEPNQPALAEIAEYFGQHVLENNELNRAALRTIIAEDSSARNALNDILHPKIQAEVHAQTQHAHQQPYNLIVVPLLVENYEAYAWVDGVIVVDCLPDMQLTRLKTRDTQHTEQTLKALIAAQSSREARLSIADFVIDNHNDKAGLAAQISALHQQLIL
jgi:dephospho-CoA kinase